MISYHNIYYFYKSDHHSCVKFNVMIISGHRGCADSLPLPQGCTICGTPSITLSFLSFALYNSKIIAISVNRFTCR